MRDLNKELVKARAQEIRENLESVQRYTSVSDQEFWADERSLYSVMHLLLTSIEATGALCSHILARLAQRAPAGYAECFEALRDLEVVDSELAAALVRMARFRSLLVHRYWAVDPERVLTYGRENLGDFEAFLTAVGRLVAEGG